MRGPVTQAQLAGRWARAVEACARQSSCSEGLKNCMSLLHGLRNAIQLRACGGTRAYSRFPSEADVIGFNVRESFYALRVPRAVHGPISAARALQNAIESFARFCCATGGRIAPSGLCVVKSAVPTTQLGPGTGAVICTQMCLLDTLGSTRKLSNAIAHSCGARWVNQLASIHEASQKRAMKA